MRERPSESGFNTIELIISATVTMAVLGAALAGFIGMSQSADGAQLIAGININLRSSLNVMTRDLLAAGRDIPVGGIPIPSGVNAGALQRPAPEGVALTFTAGDTTLDAVTPGQALGAEIAGVATDMITILMSDPTLDLSNEFLANIAADGSSATVDVATPIDDAAVGVTAGDLILFSNSLGNAIQMVTGVDGQTMQFGNADEMNLNQRGAGQGTIIQLQSAPGVYPPTTATRIVMVSYYLDAADPARPALVRRENFGDERVMAVGIENIQLTYDLVDGITDPVNLPEPVLPNTPDQIRKATIYIAGRSHRAWTRTAQILRTGVSTQVSLRSLSYRDRY